MPGMTCTGHLRIPNLTSIFVDLTKSFIASGWQFVKTNKTLFKINRLDRKRVRLNISNREIAVLRLQETTTVFLLTILSDK